MSTTLERVLDIPNVTVTPMPATSEPYRDYSVTVERAGKSYPVATVTVPKSGDDPIIAMPHHDVSRRDTTRRAWSRLLDAFGYTTNRDERYRATRGYATDRRGIEV